MRPAGQAPAPGHQVAAFPGSRLVSVCRRARPRAGALGGRGGLRCLGLSHAFAQQGRGYPQQGTQHGEQVPRGAPQQRVPGLSLASSKVQALMRASLRFGMMRRPWQGLPRESRPTLHPGSLNTKEQHCGSPARHADCTWQPRLWPSCLSQSSSKLCGDMAIEPLRALRRLRRLTNLSDLALWKTFNELSNHIIHT